MPQRKILLLDGPHSPWVDMLADFTDDTASQFESFTDASTARTAFQRSPHDLAFINPGLMTLPFAQALSARRGTVSDFRLFALGAKPPKDIPWDGVFEAPPSMADFQKKLFTQLRFPQKLRVLVIDDEEEIGRMVRDFLEKRVDPSFEVQYAPNGEKGMSEILKDPPDVLVLDIKMPYKDGREVYREVRKKKMRFPVIVFFDAISGDEMAEMRKHGSPAVVEKGAPQSALPELVELIKKMYYFA
ncbi:MAG TPA: response regulator [Verrucomicrobiae bacterium]|jgi:CheY-like chemotaxis protein|nr:response regulator [Verrucomicrobiae bacterium]